MKITPIILLWAVLPGGWLAAQNTYSGLFKQAYEDYQYVFQNSWEDIEGRQAELDSLGYSLMDIEAGTEGEYRLFWGIWKKDGGHTVLKRLESWDELVQMKRLMAADAMVMTDIAVDRQRDKEYYLAVWAPGTALHKVRQLTSWEGLSNDYEELVKQDFQIVDLEGFEAADGSNHYLALYHQMSPGNRTYIHRSPDMERFLTDKSYRNKSGYRLFDLEQFEKRETDFITGLYQKEDNIDLIISQLPWEEFNQQMKEMINEKGLVLVDIDIYPTEE